MPKPTCQAVGCGAPRARWQFMCTEHWKALPGPLRAQVNATWRAWQHRGAGADSAALWLAYIEACDEARRLTADREGRLAEFEPDLPRLLRLHEARTERAQTPEDTDA